MTSKPLTDNQRSIQKTLDIASQVVIQYSGAEVPDLGNLTPEGLLEEFGRLNEARKLLEKIEKTVRVRFESQIDGKKEMRGDNYTYTKKSQERTALNQGAAKEYFEKAGILAEYMSTTEVDTVTVKRN
jgi:hypothetical protein